MTEIPAPTITLPLVRARPAVMGLVGVGSAALGIHGALQVSVPVTSDYGLVALLPASFWLGLLGLNMVFVLTLRERRPDPLLSAVLVALLVVLLLGVAPLSHSTPRLEVSWRHLGIADELITSGRVDPRIDAYFSWPGFFAGIGAFFDVGQVSPRMLALVAPVLNGLAWAFGVAAVARSLTSSRHHMWLAAWVFVLVNWIDQDYLSPQAFAFAAYLVVVALLLRYLAAVPGVGLRRSILDVGPVAGSLAWWRSRTPTEADGRRRIGAFVIVVLLAAVVMVSHQLTPFMMLAAVGVLTVLGRLWTPHLLAIIGLLAVLWLCTGASFYLTGHPVLFAQSLAESTGANVQARLAGSPGHVDVVHVRTALTGVTMLLAGLGWLRLMRRGQRDVRPLLLMAFPFGMVPLQSYGGEMLMRATLFSLPFASYYIAGLFIGRRPTEGIRWGPGLVVLSGVLSVAVLTAHFGNAAFDMFTKAEVRGVRQLYRIAPPGAVLISTTHATAWKSEGYDDYHYATMTDTCELPLRPKACHRLIHDRALHEPAGGLVLVTRAERESLRIRGDAAPGVIEDIERLLVRRGEARLVYLNEDVRIYQFPGQAQGAR